MVVIANVAEGSNQIKPSVLQTEGLGDLWAWESRVHGEGVSGGGEAEGMRDQDVQLDPGRVFVFNGRNLRGVNADQWKPGSRKRLQTGRVPRCVCHPRCRLWMYVPSPPSLQRWENEVTCPRSHSH